LKATFDHAVYAGPDLDALVEELDWATARGVDAAGYEAAVRGGERRAVVEAGRVGEALAALAELQGRQPPTVHGLTIQMPPNASVTVHTRPRPRDMKPNAAGLVVLTRDPALIKENPEVEFSELPLGILPLQ